MNNDLADMCEHIDTNHGSKRRDAVESPKESGKKKKKNGERGKKKAKSRWEVSGLHGSKEQRNSQHLGS